MNTVLTVAVLAGIVVGALVIGHLVVTARALLTAWRRRIVAAILSLPVLVVVAWIVGVPLPWQIPATILTISGYLLWRRWLRTADVVTRWGDRHRAKAGVASAFDVHRHASAWSLRDKARILRPSFVHLSRWQRMRISTKEFAVPVARVGPFRRVWTSARNVILTFGSPGTGKSGWMACRILDAAGAALITSTRADLLDLTGQHRSKKGPVMVFNAVGLGGEPTTLPFDPLSGCESPTTAFERATDMLAGESGGDGKGGGDHEYWNKQGIRVLGALMHAAALSGRRMDHVLGWVADIKPTDLQLLTSVLRSSDAPAYALEVAQFAATNERTRTSITTTIMPALGWLTSPVAAAAAVPGSTVDVEDLLRSRASVYLLGSQETQSAPLVRALTGHIAREARRLAGLSPGGRLDPHLTLCLDEAGLLAPPLHEWTADMGGRGVNIIAAFQSWAQLRDRWTAAQASVILNNAATVMLFGGTKDREDLEYWSTLAGERDEEVVTADEHGRVKSRTVRKVPVFAPSRISTLPARRVIIFHSGMLPVVARAQMAWQRWDMRLLRYTTALAKRRGQMATSQPTPAIPIAGPRLRAVDSGDQAA